MSVNVLPRFHELLREAQSAEEAADLFDVHSEDKESAAEWKRLRERATEAKSELITYIRDNPDILPQLQSLMQ